MGRTHVQGRRTTHAAGGVQTGLNLASLRRPAGQTVIEVPVGNTVRAPRRKHLDIVNQALAFAHEKYL